MNMTILDPERTPETLKDFKKYILYLYIHLNVNSGNGKTRLRIFKKLFQ